MSAPEPTKGEIIDPQMHGPVKHSRLQQLNRLLWWKVRVSRVPRPCPELTHFDPVEKQDKSPLVELKNGKVYFRQKPLSLEKQSETLQGELRDPPAYH